MRVPVRWLRYATFMLLGLGTCAAEDGPAVRPNILLIVADDLGYADLGSFGSNIRTPHLDTLASTGIRFTQFHTSPLCAPTRAMLLSGNNNHVAGMASMFATGVVRDLVPGYERHLSDRIVPFPRLLQAAGYHTYMAGKWHLGEEKKHSPLTAGFERSFVNVGGAGNHFNSVGMSKRGSVYREDGEAVTYPDGKYSTAVFTDRLIEFIDSGKGDARPFFAFAAYTSPHWPLQVPDDERDRYAGQFDQGYDQLREERFESLKKTGIIPASSSLPPRNDAITPWKDLTPEQRRVEARKMELYAAMVENLDHHVGRLIAHLKSNGLYENTLIVFMSDNGAAGEDFYNKGEGTDLLRKTYDNAYANMGRSTSFVSYGPPWAEAGSAPFRRYKGFTTEGGITAPMIIAGPGVAGRGAINTSYLTVMDLAPTFLELGKTSYPADESVRPMLGESMVAFLAGEAPSVHHEDYITTMHHAGGAFLRQGHWKLVCLEGPFDESRFELYDLEADPGETNNLAGTKPEKYAAMIELWRTQRAKLGIVLPEDL